MYPTVRFSLRDCFFSTKKRRMIIHSIVARLEFERRQEQQKQDQDMAGHQGESLEQEEDVLDVIRSASQPLSEDPDAVTDTRKRTESDSSDSSTHGDGMSDEDSMDKASDSSAESTSYELGGKLVTQLAHIANRRRERKPYRLPKIQRVIRERSNFQPKTAMEAALLTPPSMELASCLLWLAVSESGLVSISTFCFWLSTGQIPLVNSFKLIPGDLRQKLEPCENFFRLGRTPTPDVLRQRSIAVAVACRLKAEHAPSDKSDVGSDGNLMLGFVSPHSAPLFLAQLVGDLRLGQSVLDRSLALLENLIEGRQPRRSEHIAALVAIAIFLEPGWRNWRIVRRCRTTAAKGGRADHPLLIPVNAAQMRLIGNGRDFDDYFCFIEENILSGKKNPDPQVEEYLASLKKKGASAERESRPNGDKDEDTENEDRGPVVRACLDVVRMDRLGEEGVAGAKATVDGTGRTRPLDFSRMHRAGCRSSGIEVDPQAVMILELMAQACRLPTRSVQLAVYEMIASLPDTDLGDDSGKSSKTDGSRKKTSKWHRTILKY
jgi:hypothetical protein